MQIDDEQMQSLDRFYARMEGRGLAIGTNGHAMRALVRALRSCADPRSVWCLRSHGTLLLVPSEDQDHPWLITVFAQATNEPRFEIAYRLPEEAAPWPDAYVTGTAASVDAAVQMVRIGMDRSRGWPALQPLGEPHSPSHRR